MSEKLTRDLIEIGNAHMTELRQDTRESDITLRPRGGRRLVPMSMIVEVNRHDIEMNEAGPMNVQEKILLLKRN